jgi:hypothetical protein
MTFDPTAIAGLGHNQPASSPFDLVKQEIEDLFDEAKNFADGEPIDSPALADAITSLREKIHEAGKRADALRVEEKRPLDEQVKAIQDRYNVYIAPKKGKVDLAKSTLDTLLTPWRTKVAAEKAAAAAAAAAEAEAARLAAQEAIRASSGNLAARADAEELLAGAKKLEKVAARADKAATTGTGLITKWVAEISDEGLALDWAYEQAPGEFMALALSLANEKVRSGVRTLPGFVIKDEKRAAAGRV